MFAAAMVRSSETSMWSHCAFAVYHLWAGSAARRTVSHSDGLPPAQRAHSLRLEGGPMTTPHNNPVPPAEPEPEPAGGTWGAPVPVTEKRSTPWSAKKIVISAAVAVVIVAGG